MDGLSTFGYFKGKLKIISIKFYFIYFQGSKIVAKQSLKLVPILGWCWSCTETIFVRRVWESDRETLVKDLRRTLADYPRNHYFNVKLNLILSWRINLLNLAYAFL